MARLYLTLYGILFLALALFVASVIWLPERVLHGTVQSHYERALLGAYALIEERLAGRPPDQWDEHIATLATRFRYGLRLYAQDQLDLPEREIRDLVAGELSFRDDGEQTQFYKRVSNSDRYLKMVLGPNPEQEEIDQVEGIVYLIESRFLYRSEAQWPAVLAELNQVFDMPLAVLALDDPELPAARLEDIRNGQTVVLGLESQNETYFHRLGDSNWVFRAGPFAPPLLLRYFNAVILAFLALLIAVAVWIWVRPVWRDLKRFEGGIRRFGTGDLDTRLAMSKGPALAPMAETFNAMAERMQGLIRSHRELTSAVSHELRTPIARLRFRVDMLEGPIADADLRRHVTAMRNDIVELEELVSESLNYARLNRERPELKPKAVVPNLWLEDLLSDLEGDLDGVAVQLVSSDDQATQTVQLDPRLMARAVKNLLRNARRHARQRVRITTELRNGQARVLVEDDGAGVPEEERVRIFEPFARLDAARSREAGGVGLGLAIVRQIARWHGGSVRVDESDLGGARFAIEWPVTQS